jgi:5S rRNA maturation endonuclease (ribonuclease M5)
VGRDNTLDDMISALDALKCKPRRSGDQWIAKCPAHDGTDFDSLTFKEINGKILTRCHSRGCNYQSIMIALNADNRKEDTSSFKEGVDFVRYVYKSSSGAPVHAKCRTLRKKGFYLQRPNGNGGWENGSIPVDKRVPYRLPEIIAAIESKRRVFIVEGEKDVHSLERHGFTATTFEGGSGGWRNQYKKWFRDGNIIIIPDSDSPGQKFAKEIQTGLRGIATTCDIVDLGYEIVEKGGKDVSDWFDEGNSEEDLKRIVNESWKIAGVFTLAEQTEAVSKEKEKPFETFGMPYMGGDCPIPGIAGGTFFVIAARLGTGKTTYIIDLVSRAIVAGKKIYISTMDEPARRLVRYLASAISGDFLYSVSKPEWWPYRRDPINVRELLTDRVILDGVRRTPEQIAEQVAKLRPDILVVDHLAKTKSGERKGDRIERIEDTCQILDDIKEAFGTAIIAASQANRGSGYKDGLIDSAALYGSDAIGHVADMIVGLQKPGGPDCDSVISETEARKISEIDVTEHYRILNTIKNRFGEEGIPTWHVMCGGEKKFFPLHRLGCECNFCFSHKSLVKQRVASLRVVSGEVPY